jgi:tetratricopeptide (TPR) repeat protein
MTSADAIPAVGIDADILDTLHRLSLRYYSHGLYEESASLLEFLLRHEPARAGLHFALAKAQQAQSHHDQALHSYRRALRLGLPDIDAHLYMGQCLIFLRQFPLAAAALQHFIAMAQLQGVAGVSPALLQRGRQLLDHVVRPHLPAPAPAASPAALKPRPAAVAAPNAAAAPTAVSPTTFSRPTTAPMEISR